MLYWSWCTLKSLKAFNRRPIIAASLEATCTATCDSWGMAALCCGFFSFFGCSFNLFFNFLNVFIMWQVIVMNRFCLLNNLQHCQIVIHFSLALFSVVCFAAEANRCGISGHFIIQKSFVAQFYFPFLSFCYINGFHRWHWSASRTAATRSHMKPGG